MQKSNKTALVGKRHEKVKKVHFHETEFCHLQCTQCAVIAFLDFTSYQNTKLQHPTNP